MSRECGRPRRGASGRAGSNGASAQAGTASSGGDAEQAQALRASAVTRSRRGEQAAAEQAHCRRASRHRCAPFWRWQSARTLAGTALGPARRGSMGTRGRMASRQQRREGLHSMLAARRGPAAWLGEAMSPAERRPGASPLLSLFFCCASPAPSLPHLSCSLSPAEEPSRGGGSSIRQSVRCCRWRRR